MAALFVEDCSGFEFVKKFYSKHTITVCKFPHKNSQAQVYYRKDSSCLRFTEGIFVFTIHQGHFPVPGAHLTKIALNYHDDVRSRDVKTVW